MIRVQDLGLRVYQLHEIALRGSAGLGRDCRDSILRWMHEILDQLLDPQNTVIIGA